MSPETKKYLIIGGALVAATIVGIIVYKKYEAGAQTSQAASDQASQDELAYIESLALQSPYASASVGGGSSIALPTAPATPSLIDQISQLEQAFGLAPASAAPAATGAGGSPPSSAGASSPAAKTPVPPRQQQPTSFVDNRAVREHILNSPPELRDEGVLVA